MEKFERLGGIEPIGGKEFDPLTEEAVCSIERKLGTSLPEDYRTFLKTYGACRFRGESDRNTWVYFEPLQPLLKRRRPHFDAFYGSARDDSYGLESGISLLVGRVPEELIPIGDNGDGSLLCLGIKGEFRGRVYFWSREEEPLEEDEYLEEFGTPRPASEMWTNVTLVASDFRDFLGRLYILPKQG